MGRLRVGPSAWVVVCISLLLLLPACGGSKPAGPSPFISRITLIPNPSFSLQMGTAVQLTASAQNAAGTNVAATFAFSSSDPGILDIAPNGAACAGTWNAPLYTTCTPAGIGMVRVTATSLGVSSAPTLVFVHPPIDNITISTVQPVNPPPPACPAQTALPAACDIQFNPNAASVCLSENQVQTLQATAHSGGIDITTSVGPFTWSQGNINVFKITPVVDPSITVATNQVTVAPNTPGQTQITASASGITSQPYERLETCPVQCIALELGVSGSQRTGATNFVVGKGTSETITATAVDVQGCIVPKPALTWVSSAPAALAVSSTCAAGTACAVTTTQPGAAAITASCTPPTCNIGFPLNPAPFAAPFIPQPVYPITAISGLVTGATTSTTVLATSRDCSTDPLCAVALYNVSTSTNLPSVPVQIPSPPNSLMFDPAGDKGYTGSEFGALAITPGSIGTSNPFTPLAAPGTPLGLVTGKVIAVSQNGTEAIFSDTVSSPNQVYVASSSPSFTTALTINSATAAAFSPDGLKAFILGDGGNSLSIYSALQSLRPPIALPTPATSVVFSSAGSFALLAGGSAANSLAIYNTCDDSAVSLPVSGPGLPVAPLFLKMIPSGNVPMGNGGLIPPLQTDGLDIFFGADSTGIDIIATTSSLVPLPVPPGPIPLNTLCPRPVVLAQKTDTTTFEPFHIDIGQGTFHPINFFVSPDATQAYIVTSDFGVLIYNFSTRSTSRIALINNASPISADISVDGTLIYVAASDGMLHALNIALGADRDPPISFSPLPNSPNSFCYTGANCAVNLVAVKP